MKRDIELTIAIHHAPWQTAVEQLEVYIWRITQHCLKRMDNVLDTYCKKQDGRTVGLAIVLTDISEIQELNQRFRGKNMPTNVLSFIADNEAPQPEEQELVLGDIIICYEVIVEEAKTQNKTLRAHLAHMIVHGLLHLLGYDHMLDEEAETMEQLERDILAGLQIDDPYAWRDAPEATDVSVTPPTTLLYPDD